MIRIDARCRRGAACACLFLLGLLPLAAGAQEGPGGRKPAAALADAYGLRDRPAPLRGIPLGPAAAEVTEVEPNDDFGSATGVAVGDVAHGVIDPAGDVDFFGIDLEEGAMLDLDVDASRVGSALDPILSVWDAGGNQVAWNDDADGLDSRIRFTAPAGGRYYLKLEDFSNGGSPGHTYRLGIGVIEPGPGDPATLLASGLGHPGGVAAGPGVLYVADQGGRVLEVGLDGSVRTLLEGVHFTDVVVDGFGDLLVSGVLPDGTYGVLRLAQDGSWTPFVTDVEQPPAALTLDRDGSLWTAGYDRDGPSARRYSPLGALEETRALPGAGNPTGLAVSPEGVLHYADWEAVWAVRPDGATRVIPGPFAQESLAFDEDGYLYVANGFLGEIRLYDPGYRQVGTYFAISHIGGPTRLAFGRGTDGSMSARLFATNAGYNLTPPWVGSAVELNPAGIRAPGLRVGADFLPVATAALPQATMGADYRVTLEIVDGGPATWSMTAGDLPAGVALEASGVLRGVPEESGVFPITLRVESGERFGLADLELTVLRPSVASASVVDHLLGVPGVLSADESRFLDLQGNRNGRVDVGDLQAFLRGGG